MSGNPSIAAARPWAVARPSLLTALLGFEALLVILYFATRAGPLGHRIGVLFDLDSEQSIPTWFSSSQLLATSLALWLAAPGLTRSNPGAAWLLRLGAAAFAFLSLDEAASIHEALSRAVYAVAPAAAPFGHQHSAWIVLYGLAGPLLLALLWRPVVGFWRAFPAPSALGVAGAVTLAIGAAGLEVLGYAHLFNGHVEVALEETLEMIGGTLMLCAAVAIKDASLGDGAPPGIS